jgi:signal transduction protein with GAF and PtsI domain
MARALSNAWDLATTLDLIARKTTEVMHVDSCTIYLLDPDGESLRLMATTGLARRALGRSVLKIGEGMTGYAVQSNEPVYSSNAQTHPHFKVVAGAEEFNFRSLLAVPMTIESRPIGALNVQTVAFHDYTAGEIEILSLIGDLAAGALAKAQLYDRQKRQLDELHGLAQVSEAVTSPQYLDDILDVVTNMAAQMMDAAVCSIFLLDETGELLTLRSARHTTTPYGHRPPLAVGQGVIGRVAESGQPLYIANVQTDTRYLGSERASEEGLVSLLSVPLSVRDRVIGVLNCYTASEREFPENQQKLFMTLANQTALAIENARLVSNAAVVREVHHRIKNNLQTVAMLMRLQLGSATPEARPVLQNSITRVHSIAAIHEVLSERGFRLVDLKEVLTQIGRMTGETMAIPNQSITVEVLGESLLMPTRAATNVVLVVNELLQNALEHAFKNRPSGTVRISIGQAPGEHLILVRDDGVGFPENFKRGLGLEIVETLVFEELNGRIRFYGAEPGTEVSIRFPRREEEGNN